MRRHQHIVVCRQRSEITHVKKSLSNLSFPLQSNKDQRNPGRVVSLAIVLHLSIDIQAA